MSAPERLLAERTFHDAQAARRAVALRPGDLRFNDDDYLDHETWIRPAFAQLGDVTGRRILDLGCGHGMAAVVLARRGACVTACDLSLGYLREAQARAEANGVRINFIQADGERLPFADRCFDAVWGNAVLHHLDVRVAARELRRVLRPGGCVVCCEPWGENPLLRWARRRLPYGGKERTADEEPLRAAQLAILRQVFPQVAVQGFQLLSMARRVLRPGKVVRTLDRLDQQLLATCPALQQFCRYVVLILRS